MSKLTWSNRWREAEPSEIEKVESFFGVKFPKEYIQCVIVNHGEVPDWDTFDFEGHSEACFGELLSFNPEQSNYILKVYDILKDRLPDRVIPFANDPGGNYICFDYRNKFNPTVVYWDHELAFLKKENFIVFICDTFQELLDKLYEYED